jgi:hypothetical protein
MGPCNKSALEVGALNKLVVKLPKKNAVELGAFNKLSRQTAKKNAVELGALNLRKQRGGAGRVELA